MAAKHMCGKGGIEFTRKRTLRIVFMYESCIMTWPIDYILSCICSECSLKDNMVVIRFIIKHMIIALHCWPMSRKRLETKDTVKIGPLSTMHANVWSAVTARCMGNLLVVLIHTSPSRFSNISNLNDIQKSVSLLIIYLKVDNLQTLWSQSWVWHPFYYWLNM